MTAIPTAAITRGARTMAAGAKDVAIGSKDAISVLASRTREHIGHGLNKADLFVKGHEGFVGTGKHLLKEKPVTTAAIVGGVGVAGTYMLANSGRSKEAAVTR